MKHKKSFIPILLAAVLFLSAGPTAVAVGNVPTLTVTPDRATAKPGETVTFEVRMTGAFNESRGLGLRLFFPVTVFDVLSVSGVENLNIPGNDRASGTCAGFANADSEQGFVAYLAYWDNAYTGVLDVPLLTVTARVRLDAATGAANVMLSTNPEHTSHTNNDYDTLYFTLNNPVFSVMDGAAQPPEVQPAPSLNSQPMTKAEREKDTIILQIGNYAAAVDASLCHIYSGEKAIVPYIQADAQGNGRTMVPVRFVAERLGATVSWEQDTQTVDISLDGNVIRMTIGSSVYTINGTQQQMDAAAEIKDYGDGTGNGRTMVPLRFVAEGLGRAVAWQQSGQYIIITEPDALWDFDRTAEQEVMNDVTLLLSPLVRDFINTEEAGS